MYGTDLGQGVLLASYEDAPRKELGKAHVLCVVCLQKIDLSSYSTGDS